MPASDANNGVGSSNELTIVEELLESYSNQIEEGFNALAKTIEDSQTYVAEQANGAAIQVPLLSTYLVDKYEEATYNQLLDYKNNSDEWASIMALVKVKLSNYSNAVEDLYNANGTQKTQEELLEEARRAANASSLTFSEVQAVYSAHSTTDANAYNELISGMTDEQLERLQTLNQKDVDSMSHWYKGSDADYTGWYADRINSANPEVLEMLEENNNA